MLGKYGKGLLVGGLNPSTQAPQKVLNPLGYPLNLKILYFK